MERGSAGQLFCVYVFQISFYVAENEIGNYRSCCKYALFKNWFLINGTASAEAFCPSIRRLAACVLWPSRLCCKCQRVLVLWIFPYFFLVFNQSALFIILLIRSIWRLVTRPSVRAGITFLRRKKIPLPGTLWLHTAQTQEGSTFQRHITLLPPAAALLSPPADCFFFPPGDRLLCSRFKVQRFHSRGIKNVHNPCCSLATKSEP